MKVVPDNSARVVGLESGDLDFVQSPVSPQDVTRVQSAAKLKVDRTPAAGYTYVNLNTADPILSDKRGAPGAVAPGQQTADHRHDLQGHWQASERTDRAGHVGLFGGHPVLRLQPGERPNNCSTRPGWKAGADGIRSKDGQKLSLVVRTHSEDPDRKQLIQVLQSEFQKVGIDATTNTVEFPAFFQDVQDGKYQVGVIGWLNLSDPDRATFRQFTIDGTANYGKYKNDQVDKLLKDARTTLDQSKAKAPVRGCRQANRRRRAVHLRAVSGVHRDVHAEAAGLRGQSGRELAVVQERPLEQLRWVERHCRVGATVSAISRSGCCTRCSFCSACRC